MFDGGTWKLVLMSVDCVDSIAFVFTIALTLHRAVVAAARVTDG